METYDELLDYECPHVERIAAGGQDESVHDRFIVRMLAWRFLEEYHIRITESHELRDLRSKARACATELLRCGPRPYPPSSKGENDEKAGT